MMRRSLALVAVAICASCSVGPDYVRPEVQAPPGYKELDGWKTAQPSDSIARGAWWEMFGDPQLDALETQADAANETVAAALASYAQARALVAAARAAYYPQITVGIGASKGRNANAANVTSSTTVTTPTSTTTQVLHLSSHHSTSDYVLPLDATWEIDLWGRVRRSVESAEANADASAADLETARLSLQAEVASDYLQLRGDDAQIDLLQRSIQDYERSLEITQNRYSAGVAARSDVLNAETLLESTRAQAIDVAVERAQLEHAIAVLTGQPPEALTLPAAPLAGAPPDVPIGVPSQLLERRPDVASAERRVAAANAQIGFERAAYYPTLTISASAGFQSSDASKWFNWASRFWSVGPALSETVFDGGLRGALSDEARAAYDQAVADYRQSALIAFQETEDSLAQLRLLEQESLAQTAAVSAATESVRVATNQYKAGTINYLDVVVVQTAALNSQRTSVDLTSRRMVAAVGLVKALGGGWQPGPPAATPPATP
jgi:NodT family efflux transporter outer membrane factor (OMF) lipoprotein